MAGEAGSCGRVGTLAFAGTKNCKTSRPLPRSPARLPTVPDGQGSRLSALSRDNSKIRRATLKRLCLQGQTASISHTGSAPCPYGAGQRRETHAFADGKLLLLSLPPSAPADAPTETQRNAPAPCSWCGRASPWGRRHWKPALTAGALGLSGSAAQRRPTIEIAGFLSLDPGFPCIHSSVLPRFTGRPSAREPRGRAWSSKNAIVHVAG